MSTFIRFFCLVLSVCVCIQEPRCNTSKFDHNTVVTFVILTWLLEIYGRYLERFCSPPPRLKRGAVSASTTPTSFKFSGSEYERFFWSAARRLRAQIRISAGGPTGGTLGRAGGLGPRMSGLTTCRSFGVWGEVNGGGDCGVMRIPCGLGMVFGPFFSWDCCLAGTDGCWGLLEEETGGEAVGDGGLIEELRSLRLKEVDRRTLDWASFKESL